MSPNEPAVALDIRGLVKRFDRPAVDGLGLTGRAGRLARAAGRLAVAGIGAWPAPAAAKQLMAWVSEEPMIYDKLTPFEYLEFVAGLWGIDAAAAELRARALLEWLGLMPHAHARCEGFSKGMRQKVALAGALVHEPKVIILD